VANEEISRAPSRSRRTAIFAASATVVLVVLIAIVIVVWRRRNTAGEEPGDEVKPVVAVQVAHAERQPIAAQTSAVGTVFPREQATVSAKISAQIKRMALLRNTLVRGGEVVAVLESGDLRAQRAEAAASLREALANERNVEAGTIPQSNAQDEKAVRDARANLANARTTYERRRTLYDKGGISEKDLDAAQLALTTAEADLRLAERTAQLRARTLNPADRAIAHARVEQVQQRLAALDTQLGYTTVRAPFAGVITEQFQFEGEYASAGGRLFTVADISQVIVKAAFADNVAAQLKAGDAATVTPADRAGDEMRGQITLVSRAADPSNRTVEVWVTLANEAQRLRANEAVQVTISAQENQNAVVVPAAAVTLDAVNAGAGTVMVVDNGSVAHELRVTVGIRAGDRWEITSGLTGGETVVVEGNYALPDGTRVEVGAPAGAGAAGVKRGPEP
jgi:HlyD family secretion protein